MARHTVEIESHVWQQFLKKLVDMYGSAYGSKKNNALNEAITLWLETKEAKSCISTESRRANELLESGEISPLVLGLLGEEETVIPVGRERRIVAEALRARLS